MSSGSGVTTVWFLTVRRAKRINNPPHNEPVVLSKVLYKQFISGRGRCVPAGRTQAGKHQDGSVPELPG